MNDILVCILGEPGRFLSADHMNVLSQLSCIVHLGDYHSLLQIMQARTYQLVAVLTSDYGIPPEWQAVEPMLPCPFFLMSGLNGGNFPALLTMIETFRDSLRVKEMNHAFSESLAYIEENLFDHELTLEKVAAQMYVSKYHYSRLFHKYIGSGFKEYVIHKRMQKAMGLLKKGYQVTEVCFAVGYNDMTHFGRVFKKTFGGKPSAFRLKSEQGKMSEGVLV